MRLLPTSRHAGRTISAWTAALSAAALAVLGAQVPAQAATTSAPTAPTAATAATTTAAPDPDRSTVQPSCGTPKPGDYACFALLRTDVKSPKGLLAGVTDPEGFGAADLRDAYNLQAGGGGGRTIALVDAYDDPSAESDMAVYRQQYGLPACTTANGCFSKVSQRGGTDYPAPDEDWAGEISLDLDMVSAIAPDAHIVLVEADSESSQDLGSSVDEAVALGAKYVSNSYGTRYSNAAGSGEDPSQTEDAHYNHPGVAVVASSGDSEYGVSYPASSPYVTSVGGTSLRRDASTARGWSESVWDGEGQGPGSGCSLYEPKPAFQSGTGCDKRAVADVSAIADPRTGVAVYQTYGHSGWAVYGGTSAASPIITATYADAGTPDPGTYPASYPYQTGGAGLNDVTTGSNGSCSPSSLCTAGVGYDGPTGLGTPDGTAAFHNGPHGTVSGTVTDAATGGPLAGATVTVGAQTEQTGADGGYKLLLPPGSYDISADAYGHNTGRSTGVQLADGDVLTRDFALTEAPTQAVFGTVTDGSGHGWPLYAKITVDGVPGAPVFTDPYTGNYVLNLPQGHTYTMHVAANYPGYQTVTRQVTIGAGIGNADIQLPVDPWAGTAPGYTAKVTGAVVPFDSATTAPKGWSVSNAAGTDGGWEFDDPGARGNNTGGDGAFAIVDSDHYGSAAEQDSSLVSPVYDFTGQTLPEVAFQTQYHAVGEQEADIDASTDGGRTWQTVWSATGEIAGPARVDVPLAAYAGDSHVQLRFHYTGNWSLWWEIDNVQVGSRSLQLVPGGLVAGTVTDANTKAPVAGAGVDGAEGAGPDAVTAATPDDSWLPDAFYWAFTKAGKQTLTATRPRYADRAKSVKVVADRTVEASFALQAGRLSLSPASVQASVPWGGQATRTVTVSNTGGAPATVQLTERPGSAATAAAGAPLIRAKSGWTPLTVPRAGAAAAPATVPRPAAGDAWQAAADLPVNIAYNAVDSLDGKVYSAYGWDGTRDLKDLYRYDPRTGIWTQLASPADTRESPAHGFIGGKLYAVGGRDSNGGADPKLEVYDPAKDTWTTGAAAPDPVYNAGSAVLDGKLYVVGGCPDEGFCGLTGVSVYDPATNSWAAAADYPLAISYESCAGIEGKLYCAGGTTEEGDSKSTYVYDPAADTWSQVADLPIPLWGSAYASANGMLVLSSGLTQSELTNQSFAYDPQTDTWSALPNANRVSFLGGGAPGFYTVGGMAGSAAPARAVSLLPGYDQANGADVSWLSEGSAQLTLQPGESVQLPVTVDASVPEIGQPGVYTAVLALSSDTPYPRSILPVTLTVAPPAGWGEISGTVLGATLSGGPAPIAGATVQIDSAAAQYSLLTAKDGSYSLWLDSADNPLTVIAAKDGYQPTFVKVRIKKGASVISDFTLKRQ